MFIPLVSLFLEPLAGCILPSEKDGPVLIHTRLFLALAEPARNWDRIGEALDDLVP